MTPQIATPSGTGKTTGIRTAGWQVLFAALILVMGLGITAWLATVRQRDEEARMEREFQQAADKLFGRTLREIQLFMEVLDSIRQLHTLSDQVTPEAFEEIVRKGMIYQRRILSAYGFVQSIPHELREAYEDSARLNRAIVRSDGRGGFEAMPAQSTYFPLTYQTPPGGLGVVEGYDFSARPEDQAAIRSMRRHGVFALGGPPVDASPGQADAHALYMFAPIFEGVASGTPDLAGFAVGLFHPRLIVATAIGDSPGGVRARLEAGTPDLVIPAAGSPRQFVRDFSLANQEWRFVAQADPDYWAAERSRNPALVIVLGIGISTVLAGGLLWMAGRSRHIEALVQRRTGELAEANHRLQGLMEERRELEDEILRITGSEKARIGRDLHDSLGQKLSGAMYLFGAYRQRAGDAAAAEGEQIASTLKDAVSQVRRIARGLAPVALTEEGLPDALRHLAEETAGLFQKHIEFYAEREGRPRDVGTAEHLYLIAQEALNNAIKHGNGTHVAITLDYDGEGGVLTIEDDGRGLPAERPRDREGGSGLRIMRHRADVFGGHLVVAAGPRGGVRVTCRFPSA